MAVPDPILTSNRGMTTPDNGEYHEVFDVIPCDDVLEEIIRRDQNFLGLFTKGEAYDGLEHRWWGVSQMPQTLLIHSSTLTTTGTTFVVPNEDAARVINRTMLIDPAAPTETMQVTTTPTADSSSTGYATITVARAVTGSAVAHPADGRKLQIMDTPYPEASIPEIQRRNEPTWFHNTFEMFERWLDLSRHEIKAKVKYVPDYFGWLVQQNTEDVLDELAYAFMHGQWSGAGGAFSLGTKTLARRTRGLLEQLKATTDADGQTVVPNVVTAARDFDLDLIEEASKNIDDAKGKLDSGNGVLMLDVDMYDAAMDIWDDRMISIERTETTVGRKVSAIETKRGHTLRLMKDWRWPKGHLALLTPSKMTYHPFVDSDWVAEKYAKTRDSENWRLYGDYSVKILDAQTDFTLFTNVTVES